MNNKFNKNKILSDYPDVLTVNALSTILQVSTTTCYSLIKNNEIKCIRIGKQIRIPKVYLYDYLFGKELMAVWEVQYKKKTTNYM